MRSRRGDSPRQHRDANLAGQVGRDAVENIVSVNRPALTHLPRASGSHLLHNSVFVTDRPAIDQLLLVRLGPKDACRVGGDVDQRPQEGRQRHWGGFHGSNPRPVETARICVVVLLLEQVNDLTVDIDQLGEQLAGASIGLLLLPMQPSGD